MLKRLYRKLFNIDPRGLAAYRIITGLLMSADGVLRLRNLEVFYLDSGAVPLSLAQETVNPGGPAFSFFFLSASDEYAVLLFALYILLGIVVAVGYRSRASIVLTFLFAVSFDVRNPFVTSYADTLYRHLLLWAMFLPVGRRWSLDAAKGREGGPSFEPASALILLQVVAMYFISAAYKIPEESWRNGKEVALIMGRDSMAWLLGQHLTEFPSLLKAGGTTWVALTVAMPLVLLLPKTLRNIHVILLIGCNILLALTVRIGAFPFVSISGLVLLLTQEFWDRIESKLRSSSISLGRSGAWGAGLGSAWRVLVCGLVVLLGVNSVDASLWNHEVLGDTEAESANGSGYLTHQISDAKRVFELEEPDWRVFTGRNYGTDRYPVVLTTTSSGSVERHFAPGKSLFQRPSSDLNAVYPTYRHRFFLVAVPESTNYMRHYIDYLCQRHDYRHVSYFGVAERFNVSTIDEPAQRSSARGLRLSYNCQNAEVKRTGPYSSAGVQNLPRGTRSQVIVARRHR